MKEQSSTNLSRPYKINASIGLIGYGKFGIFLHQLAQRFSPEYKIKIFSNEHQPDQKTFFPLAEVAECKIIILSVPIDQYSNVLKQIKHLLPKASILVDVATVKVHTMRAIKAQHLQCSHISLHPMFGPESYIKKGESLDGFRVVITGHNLSDHQYTILSSYMKKLGVSIIKRTAEEHDKELAETLFLTHYIGQIVAHGKFSRTSIDTASFASLMDSVESVKHDSALFEQVFTYNPYCKEVVKRFDLSEQYVRDTMLKRSIQEDSENTHSWNTDE